jgi:hypothetical protein
MQAFKRALALDPGFVLPNGADAATRQLYDAARGELAGRKALAVTHVPPGDVQAGQSVRMATRVESDPLGMVDQVAIFYRLAGAGAYSKSHGPKGADAIEIPGAFLAGVSAGSRVEYYVAALDEHDGELATQGTPRDPFVFAIRSAQVDLRRDAAVASAEPAWYRKWWVWALVGGAAVGGGVGIYAAAHGGSNPPTVPFPTP